MKVLGIETSCDETGLAIYDTELGLQNHILYSQAALHAQYGGVVPELASRDHIQKLPSLLKDLFADAKIKPHDLDAIAYTAGPGLIGALLVGACFARSFAFSLNIPCIPIHHMEAHLFAVMLEDEHPPYPFLALLASGGHTLLIWVLAFGHYQILGETLDDAAGEAFDKTAKLLGLGYPGGPAIEQYAAQIQHTPYHFPRPMTEKPGLDFSFSGLKTFVRTTWQKSAQDEQAKAEITYAFQDAVVDTFLIKIRRAVEKTQAKNLVVAGGVGANTALRSRLQAWAKDKVALFFPRPSFCTDNGAMIAYLGSEYLLRKLVLTDLNIPIYPRWSLDQHAQAFLHNAPAT